MTENKILSKIRKLMALAEGSEGNEAEVAGRLADQLMREHAVSLASLDEAALLEEDPVGGHELIVGRPAWMANLAWALASHCNVKAVRGKRYRAVNGKGKNVTVMFGYGHRSDLQVWEYLYAVAHREIQRLAKAHRKAHELDYRWQSGGFGLSRTEVTAFREGCVAGLRQKLYEQRQAAKAAQAHTTALAVQSRYDRAQAECARQHPRLGTFTGGVGASRDGVRAGRSISLSTGVTGKTSSVKLLGGK